MSYVVCPDPIAYLNDGGAVAVPAEPNPTPEAILAEAMRLRRAGISVLPSAIAGDRLKFPDERRMGHGWRRYQYRLPDEADIERWFGQPAGICMVAGKVSGGAEALDFDAHHGGRSVFDDWCGFVPADLQARLWIGTTPGFGHRVGYRCRQETLYCQKLAQAPRPDDPSKPDTLVEALGEGHIVMLPGGDLRAHESERPYRTLRGDPAAPAEITAEERRLLHDAARSLNRWTKPERKLRLEDDEDRLPKGWLPGDSFNAHARWSDILEPHGWTVDHAVGDVGHWTRPDKAHGTSATTNHLGLDLLHVFSSNADPFEPDESYSKFAAYALLNHEGDYRAASERLAAEGYRGRMGFTAEQREAINERLRASAERRPKFEWVGDGLEDEPKTEAEAKEEPPDAAALRADPRTAYLWRRRHAREANVSEAERLRRAASVGRLLDALPPDGLLPAFVRAHLPATDGNPLWGPAGALGLASALLNRRAWLKFAGRKLTPLLWPCCIGRTGEHKSTWLKFAVGMLRQVRPWLLLPDHATWAAMAPALGFEAPRTGGGPPDWAAAERMWRDAEPGSVDADRGVGVLFVDELAGLMKNMAQTHNNELREVLTGSYDGHDCVRKDTKGCGSYWIPRPTISLWGASTAAWMEGASSAQDTAGGWWPRWTFFASDGPDYDLAMPDEPDEALLAEAERHCRRLDGTAPAGEWSMTEEAEDAHCLWSRRLAMPAVAEHFRPRAVNANLKIALLVQASRCDDHVIGLEAVETACRISGLILGPLGRLVDDHLSHQGRDSVEVGRLRAIVRQAGIISRSEALRKFRGKAESFEAAVATLLLTEEIEAETVDTKGRSRMNYKWAGD